MKKLKFVFIALMMVSITSFAQQKQTKKATPEVRANRQTETLAKQLSLTADQKVAVNKSVLSRITTLDQIKKKYQGNKSKERNAEIREARIAFEQDMKNILTSEQFEKWYNAHKAKRVKKANKQDPKVKSVDTEENEDIF